MIFRFALLALVFIASFAHADTGASNLRAETNKSFSKVLLPEQEKKLKGWEHLYYLLRDKSSVSDKKLFSIFSDNRMPKWRPVYFKVKPKESKRPYKRRLTRDEVNNALRFYKNNWESFQNLKLGYNVPASIVLSILQIESRCGSFTGNAKVFYRLARLASTSKPENLAKTFKKENRRNSKIQSKDVALRANWLVDTFLPHAIAAIKVAEMKKVHPLALKGSRAGALGYPQFLPGNYLSFGIDGDKNKQVNLSTADDAIPSVANFLKAHGWQSEKLSPEKQAKIIWHYNRSEPYIQTIMRFAKKLERGMDRINRTKAKDLKPSAPGLIKLLSDKQPQIN